LLSPGDSFGESALVNPAQQRPVSVVAGVGGATLLVLDRACFHRLQQQAQEGQQLAAAAVQAVLAAACRPILRVGGRARTAEEVDTLAELLSGLEVRAGAAGHAQLCGLQDTTSRQHDWLLLRCTALSKQVPSAQCQLKQMQALAHLNLMDWLI
jgi:CRP-like cAMP-binding protein